MAWVISWKQVPMKTISQCEERFWQKKIFQKSLGAANTMSFTHTAIFLDFQVGEWSHFRIRRRKLILTELSIQDCDSFALYNVLQSDENKEFLLFMFLDCFLDQFSAFLCLILRHFSINATARRVLIFPPRCRRFQTKHLNILEWSVGWFVSKS